MWNGWFGGDYAEGILPRAMLFTDSDADGMIDSQETLAGLDPSAADTDGDGMTDLFELGAGRDPTKPDKDLKSLMAADGRIDDWKRLVPDLLQSSGIEHISDGACKDAPRIIKYGVLFDGDWLLVAVELDRKPPPGYWISALIGTPDSNTAQVIEVEEGQTYLFGPDHSIPLVAPFTERAIELHHHRSWLSWGSKVPDYFTVQLLGWFDGGSVNCDSSGRIQPSWAVP
jgi:hypothetical protein